MNLSGVVAQLKQARIRAQKQVEQIDAALVALNGLNSNSARRGYKMSASARAKIAAAQRRRWAKFRKAK
jgi:hypothetical protein